jgi:hypothetical protein
MELTEFAYVMLKRAPGREIRIKRSELAGVNRKAEMLSWVDPASGDFCYKLKNDGGIIDVQVLQPENRRLK